MCPMSAFVLTTNAANTKRKQSANATNIVGSPKTTIAALAAHARMAAATSNRQNGVL
jgi:hypothetical protein